MIMTIHSSFGVLECEPMTLQAIEKSIPEDTELQGTETASDDEDQEQVPVFMD